MESDPKLKLRISPRSSANHDRVKQMCDLAENQSSADIVQVSKRVRLEDESASFSEAPKTPDITELPEATDANSENGENEEIDKIVLKYSEGVVNYSQTDSENEKTSENNENEENSENVEIPENTENNENLEITENTENDENTENGENVENVENNENAGVSDGEFVDDRFRGFGRDGSADTFLPVPEFEPTTVRHNSNRSKYKAVTAILPLWMTTGDFGEFFRIIKQDPDWLKKWHKSVKKPADIDEVRYSETMKEYLRKSKKQVSIERRKVGAYGEFFHFSTFFPREKMVFSIFLVKKNIFQRFCSQNLDFFVFAGAVSWIRNRPRVLENTLFRRFFGVKWVFSSQFVC